MINNRRLVILGASGHGRVIADAAVASGRSVIGFVDHNKILGEVIDNIPVIGSDADLDEIISGRDDIEVIVGIGDSRIRSKLVNDLERLHKNIKWSTIIHPSASISKNLHVGSGSFISSNATVNTGVYIANHVVINTGAIIEHDCVLSGFSFVGPGAILAGNVSIGSSAFIGAGAKIIPNVKVSKNVTIGAGAVVLKDIPKNARAVGVPAKII